MEQNESKSYLIADYYSQHYEEVRAFVSVRLHNLQDAEDVTQNVFMRLLQIDKIITPVTLPCLVYTVARNLVCDYWRHRQYVQEFEYYLCKDTLGSPGIFDAESVYSAQEMNEILESGIAKLSDKQSLVYRLNIYEGMKVSEIALRLNISYKNTENRLGTARKTVRGYVRRMLA